ncbi:hypothetical protein NDU88_002745 [Pleurodeles waltl]|uniref:Uncharacterized protein n=1 Tax=Pleurodeles waltl TaxID=8319 RepID=A0AAV7TLE9_PLEWA|nr:hypothetical protein NDU88_002745 [Pleurodeles waltl]
MTEEPRASEPSLGAIMAAIQDLKTFLGPKLDAVTIDVTLLWTHLQKMSDKVMLVESHISLLHSMSKKMEEQVQCLTRQQEMMVARL